MATVTKPPLAKPGKPGTAWKRRAEAVKDWIFTWLIVRRDVYGKYTSSGTQITEHGEPDSEVVLRHCRGESTVGFHPISVDGKCKSVAWDIDAHDDKADPDANWRTALRVVEICDRLGLRALIFDSNGKGGYHVRTFFKKPIVAAVAYWLVEHIKAILTAEGFATIEAFPKQESITLECRYGNWLRAPGCHHKRPHWTRVWDPFNEVWLEEDDAIDCLLAIKGDKTELLLVAHREAVAKQPKPEPEPWEIVVPRPSANGGNKRAYGGWGPDRKPEADEVQSALASLPASYCEAYGGTRSDCGWLGTLMAIHDYDSGPTGLALAHEFSSRSDKYSAAVVEDKWSTFSAGGGLTIKTVFKVAYDNGWRWDRPTPSNGDAKTNNVVPKPSSNGNGYHGGGNSTSSPDEPTPEDDCGEEEIPDLWPKIHPNAFHGIAGEIVRMVDAHNEGDQVGTLVQFLVAFANLLGRRAHFVVGATYHYLNLFCVLVGLTSAGRKGTSWDVAEWVLTHFDQQWSENRIKGGLSSGEGIIYNVRDEVWEEREVKPERGSKKPQPAPAVDLEDPWAGPAKTGSSDPTRERVLVDAGVEDKRLMIVETEFSKTLKVMNRDTNTLSDIVRQAWDKGNLSTMTRNNPMKATGAHISIIAHSTQADINRHLSDTDSSNGFANRFMWLCVRRSKELPDGGQLLEMEWNPMLTRMHKVVAFARSVGRMKRDENAAKIWRGIYSELSAGKPGLLGAILGRAEGMVMRLACIYALLDCSPVVRGEHLMAALALWKYCEDSSRFTFGEGKGDPDAVKLLEALRQAPEGLTRTQISTDVFAKNKKGKDIVALLTQLLTLGAIHPRKQQGGKGRPTERWFIGRAPKEDTN